MSKSTLNYEFSDFGSKMKKIGILSIFTFISSFVANIGNIIGNILLPVRIITLILQIIILNTMLSALENAKEINVRLNSRDLEEFRKKIYYGYLISIIGWASFIVGVFFISIYFVVLGITFFVIGIILVLISGILRILGWYSFQTFLGKNLKRFPLNIGDDALLGSKFLKYSAFFHLLVFTSFIGLIFDTIGSFKLASLRALIDAKS
ncbi:MAG: hypothetical protein ACFFDN_31180 [Candidatus Hodarchaeota archaeon]